MGKEYSEKLLSPHWQRKRLEVFNRDKFTCQRCLCTEKTLNVHHMRYVKNKEPWEYENKDLVTLCNPCHEYEHAHLEDATKSFLRNLKEHFLFTDDLFDLSSWIEFDLLKFKRNKMGEIKIQTPIDESIISKPEGNAK